MLVNKSLLAEFEVAVIAMKNQISRYIQALSILALFLFFVIGYVVSIPLLIALALSGLYHFPLVYAIWLFYDYSTPFRNGRCIGFIRRLGLWRQIANYFPIKLHRTMELDPSKNYVFCSHPHGVIGLSHIINFLTESTGFSNKFPGITIHPLTLDINFKFPFCRELFTSLGSGAVEKESINHKLTKLGPGHSVLIVTGGAAEARLSDPGNPYRLKTKGRMGYVREALRAGASLVPVISFGESEMFNVFQPEERSWLSKIQNFMHRNFRFVPIIFFGESSILPLRVPINTVVGKPLDLPKMDNPTKDEISEWHAKFISNLHDLFDSHKGQFGLPGKELEHH